MSPLFRRSRFVLLRELPRKLLVRLELLKLRESIQAGSGVCQKGLE